MQVAVIMLFIFAVAIGAATFIENDYGTQSAKAIVYNAKWFEVLLFFITLTLAYNIYRFKMYKRPKWAALTFHVAFILIFVGAGVTRYIGYEGVMSIREGKSANTMVSDVMLLQINTPQSHYEKVMYLSSTGKNYFHETITLNNKKVDVELSNYLPNVGKKIVEANNSAVIDMMISHGDGSSTIFLKKGDIFESDSFVIAFGKEVTTTKKIIAIEEHNGSLVMQSPYDLKTLVMSDRSEANISKGANIALSNRILYQFDDGGFVIKKYHPNATLSLASRSLKPQAGMSDMIRLKLTMNGESKSVDLYGVQGRIGESKGIELGGERLELSYGAKVLELPFAIKLEDFVMDRYPGSNTPSSYSSHVVVIDKEKKINMPYHIYMNHILEYRGYKFFQSSYDQDEKGTVLSVNHDPGTLPTYIGYFLLTLGMVWVLFAKDGRFQSLLRSTRELQKGTLALVAMFLIFTHSPLQADEVAISKAHATKFGELVVQDAQGRMKPIDTLSKQIITKITRKSAFFGMNSNQLLLGMIISPTTFQDQPMIKIGHPKVAKNLGFDTKTKYLRFSDFFSADKKVYKLYNDVMEANRKRPIERSKYDKEVIKVDERVNISYMVYTGSLIRIFPKPNDKNNLWLSPVDAMKKLPQKDGEMVQLITMKYFQGLEKGVKKGDYSEANEALGFIKQFQDKFGKSVMPSQTHIQLEILYNNLNIFSRLTPIYILVGLILLILSFIHILKPSFNLGRYTRIVLYTIIFAFVIHTLGLSIRWYISGHAPWSNAYESMVYIAWATLLAGFLFMKNSPITLASTAILSGILLFVAHLNWLDPQITTLMPVLKSYWLMIHVAVITASYGFLGLGALLAFVTFILYLLVNQNNIASITRSIKELTKINEMSLMIGLILLTIGNFLGGVWANESWGRYWGWDPKETWAAVTILVYAVVLHLRFVPKMNSIFIYNVASLLAYSSVIMTYFGVNFYLSGLHSYAAGDPVPIPAWVLPSVAVIFIMIIAAWFQKQKIKALK
jgi:cytochrome c-type biogenesis protein CcsB